VLLWYFRESGWKTSNPMGICCYVHGHSSPLYLGLFIPAPWGVRTGLVNQVPVPEMRDVIFLHLSLLDQKKN
jgi:hypothetical protein